ncbi:hypothetical protein BDV93DRAFT_529747 [Ceratobasidium sp. AG-I]|nr:hypothetical protein BDV93DRAFT_529747 [Ceratobasidium sp. AG-I]
MYNLTSSQCFWFAGCIWDGMQALCPGAHLISSDKANTRGKFRKLSLQKPDKADVDDILYKARSEIKQFHLDLSRSKEASGRQDINEARQRLEESRSQIGEMQKEIERLNLLQGNMPAHELGRNAIMV